MSKDSDFGLDLDLQLLPEWARESSTVNRYADYKGAPERERRGRRGDADFTRRPRPPRDRDRGRGGPPRGDKRGDRRGGRPEGPGRGRRGARDERPRREEIPLPEVDVSIVPEEAGVRSLAQQIKLTGRAYPLFDIASLILKRQERFHVVFRTKRNAEGQVAQALFTCPLDDSVWLAAEEVAQHALGKHLETLYQIEKIPADPPKGTYTLVAQCPMSGVILGPPNLHDYHDKLRRLHAERFSRMPFEAYKSRIRMVTDEAVVKQWIEEQSFRLEYTCLNVPEPLKLGSREEVEAHFREHHLPNLARQVDEASVAAGAKLPPMSRGLRLLGQRTIEDQRRFPLKTATVLSQQFARQGLQFFKVNRSITHVCVARPHYLNLETTVVSEGVRRIVEYIRTHDRCRRRDLLESLAPTPPAAEAPPASETAPTSPAAPTASADEAKAEPASEAAATVTPERADTPAAPAQETSASTPEPSVEAKPAAPEPLSHPEPTPEQAAVIADLHWLIHQGHVIEFTSGQMELASPPKPKPEPARKKRAKARQKPVETKPAAAPAEAKDAAPAEAPAVAAEPRPNAPSEATEPEASEPVASQPAPTTPAESTPAPAETAEETSSAAAADAPERAPEPAESSELSEPAASSESNPESAPTDAPADDPSANAAEVLGGAPAVEPDPMSEPAQTEASDQPGEAPKPAEPAEASPPDDEATTPKPASDSSA